MSESLPVRRVKGLVRQGVPAGALERFHQGPAAGPIFTAWPWEKRWGRARPKPYGEMLADYQSWVYACVRVISNRMATVPTSVFAEIVRDGGLEREEVAQHPLVDLLRRPNRFMPRAFFWALTQTHLDLTGNAYWLKVRDRLGVTRELWPLMPDLVRVVPDPERFLVGYLYQVRGQDLAFEADEVVHIKYPNPANLWYGMGPVEAIAYEVDADLYLRIYQKVLFENDATPSGVLSTEKYITEPDAERLRARWYERYGGVHNRARVAILHSGLEFKPVTLSPKDVEFLNQHLVTREKILSAFGVPGSKVGLEKDVNRENAMASDLTFNQEAIAPRLVMRDEFITQQLARDFDPRLVVESDDPVPRNREQDRQDRQTYVQAGILTINEVRDDLGMDAVPWGEEALLPFSLVPAGTGAGPGFEALDAPPAEEMPEGGDGGEASARALGKAEADRDRRWRKFVAALGPAERRFTQALRGLFGRQKREVLGRLRDVLDGRGVRIGPEDAGLVDAILFDEHGQVLIFRDLGARFIRDMVRARGVQELLALGLEVTFDDTRQPIIEFGKQLATKYAREVNDTTRRQLRHLLLEGITAGETIPDLAKRVERVYEHATDFRSIRIARTVTIGASNAGAEEAYRQSGVVEAKEWLTARDERVRDTHQAAEGQRAAVGSAFEVGGAALRFPGDPAGPPNEIINCRCTVIPVVED